MRLPLTLAIRRSRRLLASLFVAHSLAAAGLWPTAVPFWAKIVVWAGLGVSLAIAVRRPIPNELTLQADGRLTLRYPDGTAIDCRVSSATTVFPCLVVLLLDSPSGRAAMPLPVDAVGREAHRQLRVWLRWKASARTA